MNIINRELLWIYYQEKQLIIPPGTVTARQLLNRVMQQTLLKA